MLKKIISFLALFLVIAFIGMVLSAIGSPDSSPESETSAIALIGAVVLLGSPVWAAISVWLLNRSPSDKLPSKRQSPKSQKASPKSADLSMLPERFVVFDLETTGLKAGQHEIIEIGAIRVNRDNNLHETFEALVVPEGRISAKITEITGINRAMVKADGIPLKQAIAEFQEFVSDLPLVAFNVEFDREFLRSACYRTGHDWFKNQFSCALKLSRKAWPDRRSYRLDDICKDFRIKAQSGQAHRALPDCERAMLVYCFAASELGRV